MSAPYRLLHVISVTVRSASALRLPLESFRRRIPGAEKPLDEALIEIRVFAILATWRGSRRSLPSETQPRFAPCHRTECSALVTVVTLGPLFAADEFYMLQTVN